MKRRLLENKTVAGVNTLRWFTSSLGILIGGCAAEPARTAASEGEPPDITKQPVSQVAERLATVRFTVNASGSPPLKYEWRRDGSTWAGWDQKSITLPAVTENDVGTYTVTVSNTAGRITSEPVRLTLAGAPAAPVPPPASAKSSAAARLPEEHAVIGKRVRLVASAEGDPPFTFQWLKNGKPIAGASAATLTIESARAADAGVYVCIVSNTAGSTPSPPVTLFVRKP